MNPSQKNDPRKRAVWERSNALGTAAMARVIAVSSSEMQAYGCPHCGYRSGHSAMSGGGASSWTCGECGKFAIILADGLNKSPLGFGIGKSFLYPKVRKHPRSGIPSHGKRDVRSTDGSEQFRSRGIGMDYTPGCFVCGGFNGMHDNIAAFVQCKTSGERVIKMFDGKGAYLDYREHEPDYVQVKVGACKKHISALERLHSLTDAADGKITKSMIEEAKKTS